MFTNKMVSSICWLAILMLALAIPDQVMYFYRPFPQGICFIQLIIRYSVAFGLLLLLDAIVIAKYIFIFWMKNFRKLSFVVKLTVLCYSEFHEFLMLMKVTNYLMYFGDTLIDLTLAKLVPLIIIRQFLIAE